MSLYDRAVSVGVRVDAAAVADASDALLVQGQSLVSDLDLASSQLEAAASMGGILGVDSRPRLDAKAARQAIGAFREGLLRYRAAAFQHAPAATLRDVANHQRIAAERWALITWRARLDDLTPHFAQATSERLHGSPALRQRVEIRQRKLNRIRDKNPLLDADKLQTDLGGEGLSDWLRAVATLDEELGEGLDTLDAARALQSSTVQAALVRASSESGLPLDELTDELLAELRAAGVEEQLVVRRA